MNIRSLFSVIGLLTFAGLSHAQSVPIAEAKRMTVSPKIDGVLSPGEWDSAFKITPFLDRFTQKLPKDTTDAWIGYDDKHILIAFYCHDTEPDKIVGREIIPNSDFNGEDSVLFSINTFGTRSFDQLSRFIVNVLGTQTESIAGGRAGKREWRGSWLAKTSRVADGWICEMAIPWTILNYPDKKPLTMDMNLVRTQGRTLFEQSWANVTPNPLPELQGIWKGVEPPKPPKPKIQFLGYSVAEFEDERPRFRHGFDARYAINGSVNALMSVAPDFRNIEDVIADIDFIRTERFLNETRPFFNDGGDFFGLGNGFSFGQMLYTRRIGAFDVGAKAYGQATPTLGVGALYTNQLDGQKAAVVNFNKTISATSNATAYLTNNCTNGTTNTAGGFTFFKRWNNLAFETDAAFESNQGQRVDTAGSVAMIYQRPDLFTVLRHQWVQPEFDPTLAFIPWKDRRGTSFYGNNGREWRKGPWRSYGLDLDVNEFRTYDGVLQQGGYSVGGNIDTRNDMRFGFNRSRFTFSGSRDETTTVGVGFNVSNRFKRYALNYTSGTQGDLPSTFLAASASYRLIDNLDIGFSQSILERADTQRQSILTVAYQLSNDQLLAARVSSNSFGTNAYISYRKAGLAGTEYYLILGDPNAQTTQRRISAKIVYAF